MHQYFANECRDFEDGLTLELEPSDVEIINLYSIENGKYKLGDISKYISVAAK